MRFEQIKIDCRYFRGDIPCKPHKLHGVHCIDNENEICRFYDRINKKILIIKLGAIGDVIRTTPLFTKLKQEYPTAKFYWITDTPVVVPQKVDEVLKYGFDTVNYLKEIEFDIAINLDKDKEACALLNQISADEKFGFSLKNNFPYPVNRFAEEKFLTGIFDDISKRNKKNYLEEMFEICGFKYNNEKYLLYPFYEYENEWKFKGEKKIIGLNTGCGGRWTSRLWPEKYWIELAQMLLNKGFDVLFLGGKQEHEKNKRLSIDSGAKYLGYFKLEKFINLVNQCDLVVTAVTMAMHITLALGKNIVLMNNIFNPNEFELFGLGEIIQPEKECKCFFSSKCTNQEYNCMEYLKPADIFNSIIRQLK